MEGILSGRDQEHEAGLTEIIVHLGQDDAELQAVMVDHPDYGSAWRQRDFDVVSSPEMKKAMQDNHIVLIKWKDLQSSCDDFRCSLLQQIFP